ncbi:MAG: hypothetical protein Q9162_000347 [Coniocarpon cinnabarinum]
MFIPLTFLIAISALALPTLAWNTHYPHQEKSEYDAQTPALAAKGVCRFYYLPLTLNKPVDNKLDTCIPKCGTNSTTSVECVFDKQNDPFEEWWRYDPAGNLWGLGFCRCNGGREWMVAALKAQLEGGNIFD